MTNKPQEVFDQSISAKESIYAFDLNTSNVTWQEVAGTGRNRGLRPIGTQIVGLSSSPTEPSNSGNPSVQIIRGDLNIEEDILVKMIGALFVVTTSANIAAGGISCELAATYVNPQGTSDQTAFYDQTISSSAATNAFKFHMPYLSLQKICAKGGTIQFVITITANYAAPAQSTFQGIAATGGDVSFLKVLTVPLNTSKDQELTNERLPT